MLDLNDRNTDDILIPPHSPCRQSHQGDGAGMSIEEELMGMESGERRDQLLGALETTRNLRGKRAQLMQRLSLLREQKEAANLAWPFAANDSPKKGVSDGWTSGKGDTSENAPSGDSSNTNNNSSEQEYEAQVRAEVSTWAASRDATQSQEEPKLLERLLEVGGDDTNTVHMAIRAAAAIENATDFQDPEHNSSEDEEVAQVGRKAMKKASAKPKMKPSRPSGQPAPSSSNVKGGGAPARGRRRKQTSNNSGSHGKVQLSRPSSRTSNASTSSARSSTRIVARNSISGVAVPVTQEYKPVREGWGTGGQDAVPGGVVRLRAKTSKAKKKKKKGAKSQTETTSTQGDLERIRKRYANMVQGAGEAEAGTESGCGGSNGKKDGDSDAQQRHQNPSRERYRFVVNLLSQLSSDQLVARCKQLGVDATVAAEENHAEEEDTQEDGAQVQTTMSQRHAALVVALAKAVVAAEAEAQLATPVGLEGADSGGDSNGDGKAHDLHENNDHGSQVGSNGQPLRRRIRKTKGHSDAVSPDHNTPTASTEQQQRLRQYLQEQLQQKQQWQQAQTQQPQPHFSMVQPRINCHPGHKAPRAYDSMYFENDAVDSPGPGAYFSKAAGGTQDSKPAYGFDAYTTSAQQLSHVKNSVKVGFGTTSRPRDPFLTDSQQREAEVKPGPGAYYRLNFKPAVDKSKGKGKDKGGKGSVGSVSKKGKKKSTTKKEQQEDGKKSVKKNFSNNEHYEYQHIGDGSHGRGADLKAFSKPTTQFSASYQNSQLPRSPTAGAAHYSNYAASAWGAVVDGAGVGAGFTPAGEELHHANVGDFFGVAGERAGYGYGGTDEITGQFGGVGGGAVTGIGNVCPNGYSFSKQVRYGPGHPLYVHPRDIGEGPGEGGAMVTNSSGGDGESGGVYEQKELRVQIGGDETGVMCKPAARDATYKFGRSSRF